MDYLLRPVSAADAAAIAGWRYEPPYDFYDLTPDALPELLDPRCGYLAATTGDGALAGFFCFGAAAQVPGGQQCGAYGDPTLLDIGLGLHPDLTGSGHGVNFAASGLNFARAAFFPAGFRLTVAAFNERAIRVYERIGFRPVMTFPSPTRRGNVEFLLMTRNV